MPRDSHERSSLDEEIAARVTAYLFGEDATGEDDPSRERRKHRGGWRRGRRASAQAPNVACEDLSAFADYLRGEVHRIVQRIHDADLNAAGGEDPGRAASHESHWPPDSMVGWRGRRRSHRRGVRGEVRARGRRVAWSLLTRLAVLVIFAIARRGRRRRTRRARGFSV